MRKIISYVLCSAAFIYTIWYMHFGIPYKNSGALSKIGLEHHGLFIIWGFITFIALANSVILAYERYTKTKIYIPLLVFAGLGMALTLLFDFDFNKKHDYFLHCAGSLSFSVLMGITVFLLFLLCYKRGLIFRIFTYISAFILFADLVFLLIFKENALIETIPVFAGYIMLCAVNLRRDKIEIK